MNDSVLMRELCENLWNNYFRARLNEALKSNLSYFKAKVVSAASGGKITVQRPFDGAISIPYADSASGLQIGDYCIVLVFGDENNAIILCKADFSTI